MCIRDRPDTMTGHIEEGDIAIVGDREEAQAELIKLNVSLMIVTGGDVYKRQIIYIIKILYKTTSILLMKFILCCFS